MRKKPPGISFNRSAHQVEREYRVMYSLAPTNVPVPRMVCLCEDVSVVGTAFYIMEYLEGRAGLPNHLPDVTPEHRFEMWRSAVQTLAKLHLVNHKYVGLGTFGKDLGYYNRQLKTFTAITTQQAAVIDVETKQPVGAIPHVDEMITMLRENQPGDRTSIVHGDFKLDNLLFHPTEPRVIGVLDWELATIGHPLSDVSTLLNPLHPNSMMQRPELAPGATPGMPSLSQCVAWYKEASSYDVARDLAWGRAFYAFKTSCNMQGIAARYAARQHNNEGAGAYLKDRERHAADAWRTLQLSLEEYRAADGPRL
jgi:aminoglycoside phosphotransferase (APT) family kinase protein